MITIRAGNGLGDAIYLRAIAQHLVKTTNQTVEVATSWPDVYRPLERVVPVPFRRNDVNLSCHYTKRKEVRGTSQFEDMWIQAGISGPVDLRINWRPINTALIDQIPKARPIVLVMLPREPFDRGDNFGIDLLPTQEAYQTAVDAIANYVCLVQVGKTNPQYFRKNVTKNGIYSLDKIGLNYTDATSVTDLFDLAYIADGFLGYTSFFIPLAESFNKPLLCIWSSRFKKSEHKYLRTVSPEKLLHGPKSKAVMENAGVQSITSAAHAFLEQVRSQAVVREQNSRDRGEWAGSP